MPTCYRLQPAKGSSVPPARRPHPQANSEWYECYNMLHSALDKLPKVESEDRMLSSLVDVIGGREDYPESLALTPAASESVSTLIRATEQLLSTGESPRGAVELVEAETCRKVCLERTDAEDLEDTCGLQRGISCLEYTLWSGDTASPQLAPLSVVCSTYCTP